MNFVLVIALILPTVASAVTGGAVGNGGGFALCSDRKLYSYDFLIIEGWPQKTARESRSVKSHMMEIYRHLLRLNDPLAEEFNHFVTTMYKQTPGAKFQWFAQTPLATMWEPDLDLLLPAGCRNRKQAAYYFAPVEDYQPYAAYRYDPVLIGQVEAQEGGRLQVSYLWVHEWLWNYFDRADFLKLARFNHLLNSAELESISSVEYYKIRPTEL